MTRSKDDHGSSKNRKNSAKHHKIRTKKSPRKAFVVEISSSSESENSSSESDGQQLSQPPGQLYFYNSERQRQQPQKGEHCSFNEISRPKIRKYVYQPNPDKKLRHQPQTPPSSRQSIVIDSSELEDFVAAGYHSENSPPESESEHEPAAGIESGSESESEIIAPNSVLRRGTLKSMVMHHQKKKGNREETPKRSHKRKHPAAKVHTPAEDEVEASQKVITTPTSCFPPKSHKPTDRKQTSFKIPTKVEILKLLARTRSHLASFARAGLLVEIQADEDFQELKEHCSIISQMIPSDNDRPQVPSTIDLYDQVFLYHGQLRMTYLVQTLHVFAGNANFSRNKTFGMIRYAKTVEPLKGTFSGWIKPTDDHPLLLDPGFWCEEVKYFSAMEDYDFQNGSWDRAHGQEKGHTHAAHAEPRLMLWFACEMVEKRLGVHVPQRRKYVKYFRMLKEMFNHIEADVILSHCHGTVCRPCLAFQQVIQRATGIKYNIIFMKNVGDLKAEKHEKTKANKMPLFAVQAEEDKLGDEEDELEPLPRFHPKTAISRRQVSTDSPKTPAEATDQRSSTLQVVIRSKTTTGASISTQHNHLVVEDDPFPSIAREASKALKNIGKAKKKSHKFGKSYQISTGEDRPGPFPQIAIQTSKALKKAEKSESTEYKPANQTSSNESYQHHTALSSARERFELWKRQQGCWEQEALDRRTRKRDKYDNDEEFLPLNSKRKKGKHSRG